MNCLLFLMADILFTVAMSIPWGPFRLILLLYVFVCCLAIALQLATWILKEEK
jgi:hypothetical protein